MKSTFPLLALLAFAALSLSACNTDVTRRDLYSPAKGNGPNTRALKDGTWKERGAQPVAGTPKPSSQPALPTAPAAPIAPPAS